MYRTDRIYVTENHELYAYLDDFAHKAKCLHNAALFRIRNAFTAHNKTALTANEKEVRDELALLKGQKSYYVLGYGILQRLMRITNNPDFFSGLPIACHQTGLYRFQRLACLFKEIQERSFWSYRETQDAWILQERYSFLSFYQSGCCYL